MQDLIKRYFWVLTIPVVMTCAVFAAKGVNQVIAAKYLGEPAKAPVIAPVVQATPVALKPVRSKDGTGFATRDMFCSDCTPPPPVAGGPGSAPGDDVPLTTLPLSLLATNVGADEAQSYATVINTENQHQGSYGLGDAIPGAGPLRAIHFKYIDFENTGHLERLALQGAPPVVAVATPAVAAPAEGDDLNAQIKNGVKKIDDTHYEIDKNLLDKVLANPMAVAKGARIVPAVKNGKPDGFKLYAIKPDSVYAQLGLTNGDTLESINGFELTSADKALEVYTKLREATSLEISVTRRGKPMTIDYSIR
jgi:general secretion pathway protein C